MFFNLFININTLFLGVDVFMPELIQDMSKQKYKITCSGLTNL